MYKVCGFTNYECTCGKDQIFGSNLCLTDAIKLFLSLTENSESLDFSELDDLIEDWAIEYSWDEEDYYASSYGGCIILYEEALDTGDFDREIISVRVERDPIKKTIVYNEIEVGAEATLEEKNAYFSLCK